MTGKMNMVFGFIYLLAATVLSLYSFETATTSGAVLSSAFLQANVDAFVNIAGGYLILRMPFVDWVSKTVSALMIAGAFLHSGMLYSSGFGLVPFAAMLMPLGLLMLAGVMLFMGIGFLSLKAVR